VRRFWKLHDDLRQNHVDQGWLARVEYIDNIFPAIDYSVYAPRP
jgi:1,4-alpha-glucan branching enzyme